MQQKQTGERREIDHQDALHNRRGERLIGRSENKSGSIERRLICRESCEKCAGENEWR